MSRRAALRQKLTRPFRVTVQREETFEETGVYSVNLANLLGLGLGLLVALALVFFALVALTPLRELVPGYGEANEREVVTALNRRLREIEGELADNNAYTANIQRVLVGDTRAYDEAAEAYLPEAGADEAEVARIPEDQALREEVASARGRGGPGVAEAGVPLDQMRLASPLAGSVSGAFAPTARHFGVDVVAPAGSPVKTILDGYVVEAGYNIETGNVIAVQHPGNLLSFYKHNASLLKRAGDFVRAGEAIAVIGNTGTHTDGPHVHLELWHRGQPIDPAKYLRFD